MPRDSMDTAKTRPGYGIDMDFMYKNLSIRYNTTQRVAYFEVSVHHRLQVIRNR